MGDPLMNSLRPSIGVSNIVKFTNSLPSLLVKRTFADYSGGIDQNIYSTVSSAYAGSAFQEDSEMFQSMRAALPDPLARALRPINNMDTGPANHTDEMIVTGLFSRVWDGGFEKSLSEKVPIFCSTDEPQLDGEYNAHTLGSPAILNWLFEMRAYATALDALVNTGDLGSRLLSTVRKYEPYTATTALEAYSKWAFVGHMASLDELVPYANSTAARMALGSVERLIGISSLNRTETFNIFAPTLRPGDVCFYTFRDVNLSWTSAILDPLGAPVVGKVQAPSRVLQLVGFSHRDTDVIAHDSSLDGVLGSDTLLQKSEPRDTDLDYWSVGFRAARDWIEYDYDPDTDRVEVRQEVTRIAGVELDSNDRAAIQERLADMPDLVFDQYRYGYPIKAGMVREVRGRDPSVANIRWGTRSNEAMKQLPVVQLYGSA